SIPHLQAAHTPWLRHQSTIIRLRVLCFTISFLRTKSPRQPSRSSPPSCTTDEPSLFSFSTLTTIYSSVRTLFFS
ncbi:hypothetical protein PENTCL1PPCAC_204, partial [Pristionchus entomophagus]